MNSLHMTLKLLHFYYCEITLVTLISSIPVNSIYMTLQFLPLYCCEITLVTLIRSIPVNSIHMTLQHLPPYCCEITLVTLIISSPVTSQYMNLQFLPLYYCEITLLTSQIPFFGHVINNWQFGCMNCTWVCSKDKNYSVNFDFQCWSMEVKYWQHNLPNAR